MDNPTLQEKLNALLPGKVLSSTDRFGSLEVTVDRKSLAEVVRTLRDDKDLAFDMLIDLVALDFSQYPEWTGDRFAVNVLLKSLPKNHRLQLKATAPEDDPSFPTLTDLYANADWLEREAWDQMGLKFNGHPNLKRLLNHHEFVGHPLRKDYPITRRQWLSANESLMDEMDVRLKAKGYR
jgi:NADH-quinone oxidoreductase subunit C